MDQRGKHSSPLLWGGPGPKAMRLNIALPSPESMKTRREVRLHQRRNSTNNPRLSRNLQKAYQSGPSEKTRTDRKNIHTQIEYIYNSLIIRAYGLWSSRSSDGRQESGSCSVREDRCLSQSLVCIRIPQKFPSSVTFYVIRPRFRVCLPTSNDQIKKTSQVCPSCLSFS